MRKIQEKNPQNARTKLAGRKGGRKIRIEYLASGPELSRTCFQNIFVENARRLWVNFSKFCKIQKGGGNLGIY